MKLVEPTNKLYCSYCGTQMVEKLVGAEKYDAGTISGSYYPYCPYDEKTGKRQYLYKYTCPNKSKFWFGHTSRFLDKIITFDYL